MGEQNKPNLQAVLACSFCGNEAGKSIVLIAGPKVFICAECVALCSEVVADRRAERRMEERLAAGDEAIVSKADAERLAWMRTWTVAQENRSDG